MIQYEGLKLICFKCGHLGHKEDGCPLFQAVNGPREEVPQSSKGPVSGEGNSTSRKVNPDLHEKSYGAWMLVQRQPRRANSKAAEAMRHGVATSKKKSEGSHNDFQTTGSGSPRIIARDNHGSRFEILGNVETEIQLEGVINHVQDMSIEKDNPMDVPMAPRTEEEEGVRSPRSSIGRENLEVGNGFAHNPEAVKPGPGLEDGLNLDNEKEAGDHSKSMESTSPSKKDTPFGLGNNIPKIGPKISDIGNCIPLTSLSKGPSIRNAKFKKGHSKKPSRLGASGKENLDSKLKKSIKPRAPLAVAIGHQNESLPNPYLAGIENSPGRRGIYGASIGGAIRNGRPPPSEPGDHRGKFLSSSGESDSIDADESGSTICDRRTDEGLEGDVPVGTTPNSS